MQIYYGLQLNELSIKTMIKLAKWMQSFKSIDILLAN